MLIDHRLKWILQGVCILLLAADGPSWAIPGDQGFQLKAAFVLNFLRFTEWPAAAAGEEGGQLRFAVIGEGPIAHAIEQTLDGKPVQGRQVEVHRFPDLPGWKAAGGAWHALFATPAAWKSWHELRAAIADRAVLTIAESPGFCAAGGMINLFEQDNRLRFEANPRAADEAGLRLKAELLKLAAIVRTDDR